MHPMTPNRMLRFLFFLPALSYMALIFFLSSQPAPEMVGDWPTWFGIKSIHLLEYAFLAALLSFGFDRGTGMTPGYAQALVVLLTGLYGVSDEFHQSFNPYRTALVLDAVTDFLAAILFAAAYALIHILRRRLAPADARRHP